MKLIVHAIGVLMVSGAMSLAIAPILSLAQPAMSNFSGLPGVMLTPEQAEQLKQLDAQTRSHLQGMLTPTQLTQLECALKSADGISRAEIVALNLSPAQQVELMQILMSTQQQATDVLTPDQIETVRRNLPFHP
ncbi:hypothetical protein [Stenomitos frigidus]|uniref:P pilus assembly/Cpx signaling pathway, periplasmic inhibitor/zinc-resistance associated protein n=1 Tax=Stenomitos frigidus ULC18 TaxID=2107698 RepID=A0A2T1EBC6_9CYAN|nr:hypothetical protein [Stenomitos frigidus]PSB30066.1 hypothetical protein C7B82_09860 [Stenomitos frigidus ULC18]